MKIYLDVTSNLFLGFPREQAEVVTRAFVDVINTNIEHQTKTLVTKPQQVSVNSYVERGYGLNLL